jgi:glycosyltransferase involved in cell wall biosynthesis
MPTPDNYRAGSAHPYHLIKYRPDDVEIEAYIFNSNGVRQDRIDQIANDLNISIKVLKGAKWFDWMFKLHLSFLKNFLPYPFGCYYPVLSKNIINEINIKKADGIWFWGDTMIRISKLFPQYQRVLTLPDSVALYYHRLMGDHFLFGSFYRMVGNCIQYYKNIKMEREYSSEDNIHYHLVGEADRQYLNLINPSIQAHFIRHPHYNIIHNKTIRFSQPKIKILLAGQYNLYMKTAFDSILPALCEHKELALHYSITFLGKGWGFAVEELKAAGYESERLGFVDVYVDEIIKYDIQLTPISVGTGTKGKVLDAIANGLLVIGTPYAMENIAVEDGTSCFIYNTAAELINKLDDIYNNITIYEQMAGNGRKAILEHHDRTLVSKQLFDLFKYNL